MAKQTGTRGYSDETVRERTGRSVQEWFAVLDAFDVRTHGHTKAARHLKEAHQLPGWWAQMVTVRYEYAHGLRSDDVAPPPALKAALKADAAARKAFDALTQYQRSRTAEWIAGAKGEDTRDRRIARTLEALREGKLPPGI